MTHRKYFILQYPSISNFFISIFIIYMGGKLSSWIRSSSDRVKKKIECPVCLENFSPTNMVFFVCTHSLCKICLQHLLKHECPICRRQILF